MVMGETSILLHNVICVSTSHYSLYERIVSLKTKDVGNRVAVVTVFSRLCLHPSSSAGSHGADGSVTELGHGRPCCHNVLLVVT